MVEAYAPEIMEAIEQGASAKLTEIAHHFSTLLKETINAKKSFGEAQETREKPSGINWKDAYIKMVHHLVEFAFKAGWPPEVRQFITDDDISRSADLFMHDLNELNMEDLLYEEMKDPTILARLLAVCSNLRIWTMGDIANKNQEHKVVSSGIATTFDLAKKRLGDDHPQHQIEIEVCIKNDKTAEIPDYLDRFWEDKGEPEHFAIIIIDDSRSTYKSAEREIANWEARHAKFVKVKRIYIRSKRGKKAEAKWEPINHTNIFEGKSAQQFADIASKELESSFIDPSNAIMLLDFDGTVADNIKLNELQLQLVHKHLNTLLEETISEWLECGGRELFEDYSEDDPIYEVENNRKYIKVMLDRIVPLWRIETPFCKQSPIFSKLEAEIGYRIDADEMSVLQDLDMVYRRTGGLLTWKDYRLMIGDVEKAGHIAKYMNEIGNWEPRFQGIAKYVDDDFFQNTKRVGDIVPGMPRSLYNLTSEYARNSSQKLAVEIEREIESVCRGESGSPKYRFVSGGVKARNRMEEKIQQMGESQVTTAYLNEILDLVRGKIIVEDIAQLAECTAALTGVFGDRIVKFNNYYQEAYQPEGEPVRAFKATRLVLKLSEEFTYELQVQTKRSKAAGDFDHETTMKGKVALTPEEEDYTRSIFWFANIMDYEEFLAQQPHQKQPVQVQGSCGNIEHQSGTVRRILYNCWLKSGAIFHNPVVLQEFIDQVSSRWDEKKPDHIDKSEWDKKKEKIIYLIRTSEEELKSSMLDVGLDYHYHFSGQKYMPYKFLKSRSPYREQEDNKLFRQDPAAFAKRRTDQINQLRQKDIDSYIERLIQEMEKLVLWSEKKKEPSL